MNIGLHGWRTNKTHVRKFGGVWYQLIEVEYDTCDGCDIFAKHGIGECPLISSGVCYPKYWGGMLQLRSQYREVGEI
jgi:hypothetical protein